MISSPPVCADGSDTTSVPTIASSFSESWWGRKNCPLPYTSIECSSARSRDVRGSPSSSRKCSSARFISAVQPGPPSVIWSGVSSHVSRTLVSVSVSSARPNIAGRATAINFFARGARTGRLTGPTPDTLSWRRWAGASS